MRALILTAIVSLAFFWSASAQPETIIKQRARSVGSGGNNARPTSPAPSGATVRPMPVATPASSQQQHISRLKADLAAVRSAGAVSEQAKKDFARDLLGIASGSNKPSSNSVNAVANTLLPALTEKKLSTALLDRLVQKLVVLANSHGLSETRAQEIADEAQTALTSAGISTETAAQIAMQLRALAADVQHPASL